MFKKIILSIITIVTISLSSYSQAPESFSYQAVIRDAGNTIINNQAIGMRLTLQQGSIGGLAVYTETFAITTNDYGLVNLEIGTGTSTDNFTTIDWANGPYFMETAIDLLGGTSYTVMGTSQLMSVPYALHAKIADNVVNDNVNDADNNPTNELQTLNISNDTVYLSNGGYVYLGAYAVDNVDDADSDPTNELQIISFSNDTLYLSNGGNIFLGAYAIDNVNDADSNPTNEIQILTISNDTIYLNNGGGSVVAPLMEPHLLGVITTPYTTNGRIMFNGKTGWRAANDYCKASYPNEKYARAFTVEQITQALVIGNYGSSNNYDNVDFWAITSENFYKTSSGASYRSTHNNAENYGTTSGSDINSYGTKGNIKFNYVTQSIGGGIIIERYFDVIPNISATTNMKCMCGTFKPAP